MKDVKVDVRVNVTVDAASVVLLIATTTMAYLFYQLNKQGRQDRLALSKPWVSARSRRPARNAG
ncbi:hypothetical protein ACFOHT_26500 [Massilia oculi]|uniref:hypothetical protein n=1 Tax=Massilia oculi TaxID=945844 RepID=UPI0013B3BF81|nr:hypothetical protein [Massilia oculi]